MEHLVNFLCSSCGTHEKVAESLGYTKGHYRKIRKKIALGETIPARIENLLRAKALELRFEANGHVL
jgi:hypothetical protein